MKTIALPGTGSLRRLAHTFVFTSVAAAALTAASGTAPPEAPPGPTPTEEAIAEQPPSPQTSSADSSARDRRAVLRRAFRDDLRAFEADLRQASGRMRGGHLTAVRARNLARIAVGEAYRYQIPPALIFGVMLQENPWFDPVRRSYAGAVGLMQVMPTVWMGECGPRFGRDLTDDRTNILCGSFVLAHYANVSAGHWRETLWRYNGWGPEYPTRVRKHVERRAHHLCPSARFERCVTRPLDQSFGDAEGRDEARHVALAAPVR